MVALSSMLLDFPGSTSGDAPSSLSFCQPSPHQLPCLPHRRFLTQWQRPPTVKKEDAQKHQSGPISHLKPTYTQAKGPEARGSTVRRNTQKKHGKEQQTMANQCNHVWDLIKSDTTLLQWYCGFCHDGPRAYIWQSVKGPNEQEQTTLAGGNAVTGEEPPDESNQPNGPDFVA
ncbi:hypothetical protein MAPG_01033 [Magnaporthiopsis poae ATCC 64411]|uniref:Uncharacterized protein n=1 Tax=Magnaporthiopsis poae (strain ATCC 64411 / 73-15) TaxID=644358 RepID=A0A0C4DMM2_MAGP6|nr:hypothetical protein MAPG_01033 [Magnaporthiopsis poae ATCC 64411]